MSNGMAIWLSALGRPGTGIASPSCARAASLFHLAPLRRRVRALLPQVADVHHPALLRDHADHAGPDLDASADCLILVATACDDAQRPVVGLENENVRVVKLEQLVHRPQGGVADLVEIERGIDVRGHALQDLHLGDLPLEFRDCSMSSPDSTFTGLGLGMHGWRIDPP